MNLFLDYQKKIFKSLKSFEKKKKIKIPKKLKSFAIELPPKNQKADISCNAAMVLAKLNNTTPLNLAEILKKYLLKEFKEFKSIEIAGPGFLNIYFDNSKSMGSINSKSEIQAITDRINTWASNNQVNNNWYLFGDSLREMKGAYKLDFSDNYTSVSGLEKNIILNIQINSISEKINNQYNFIIYDKINNKRCHDGINIHLHDIPYASDNIEKYRNIIDKTINNKKHILYFSHYCCNNKGIMYKFNDPLNRNHHFLLS